MQRHELTDRSTASRLAGTTLALLVLSAGVAAGATLRDPHRAVTWASTLEAIDAVTGGPAICAAQACERFDVEIDLPAGIWNRPTPGAVQFSTQWAGFGNNMFLYVFRDGVEVARQEGIISTAYSIHLPEAQDGSYSIYVALDPESVSDTIPYEGMVEVEYAPHSRPTRRLLPDLAARPQRNVTFDTPLPVFFEPPPTPGESCNQSEMDEDGASVCLRFDQVLANIGEGPLDLRFVLPHDPASPDTHVIQRIHWSDDPENHVDERIVDDWEFHDIHPAPGC